MFNMKVMKAPKAVSSILSAFEDTIDKLNKAADDHNQYADSTELEAQRLQREADQSKAEAVRATEVASKMRALVGSLS